MKLGSFILNEYWYNIMQFITIDNNVYAVCNVECKINDYELNLNFKEDFTDLIYKKVHIIDINDINLIPNMK